MPILAAYMVPHPPLIVPLIVPGENDTAEEIRALSSRIAGLQGVCGGKQGRDIPHAGQSGDRCGIGRLADTAGQHLRYVYAGNCE